MEEFMRKPGILLLATLMIISFSVLVTSCDKAVPDPTYNYRVTGHMAGWGSNFDAQYIMENVSRSDSRIQPLKGALKDAQHIYLWEYTINPANAAGWTADFPGVGISADGMYCVKFIRLEPDASEPSGWAYNMWMPSTESGGFGNISPDTLYVPPGRSNEERDAAGDGLGSVNDNPVLLKGVNTYYVVFAVMKDRSRVMGAVVK